MKTAASNLTGRGQGEDGGRPRLEPDSLIVGLISTRTREGRPLTEAPSNGSGGQRLIPRQPPGRTNRKARAFSAEIDRLHGLGYSFNAIREALADVGVKVSLSTVQREVMRHAKASLEATPAAGALPG